MKYARDIASFAASLILALGLAVFIWITATQQEDPIDNQFLTLAVTLAGQPENSILTAQQQPTTQIRIEGPVSVLRSLSPGDFLATADLSQVPFGQTFSVPIQISAPTDELEISLPSPSSLEVLLEQQVAREIPVELDVRGSVARGHAQGDPLIDPATITVSGPASLVEDIDFALTTVFLNNARETSTASERPIFYDEQGRVISTGNLRLSTNEVQVTVPVEESAGFAEKLITVEWIGEPAPGYRLLNVQVSPPSVLVRGFPEPINALTSISTEAIDITGLNDSFSQQVSLNLPAGISLDQDQEIFVDFEIEPILSTDTRRREVEVLGLAEGLEASLRPESIRVVLFGPLPVLDTLIATDVRVTVDTIGLEEGSYGLEPRVDIPDRGIEVRSISPNVVAVTITKAMTMTEELSSTMTISDTTSLVDDIIFPIDDAGLQTRPAKTANGQATPTLVLGERFINLPPGRSTI